MTTLVEVRYIEYGQRFKHNKSEYLKVIDLNNFYNCINLTTGEYETLDENLKCMLVKDK